MTLAADPVFRELPRKQRALLGALWQERAESESAVRMVFHQFVEELVQTGAHAEVISLARRAADDEARHADICAQLAAAYRGELTVAAIAAPVRLPDYVPDLRLRAALHAVNLCCIGETIATAFVEACVAACGSDVLAEVHRRHLADEIRHARVGWAHVASLTAAERVKIGTWLPELLRVQMVAWESRLGELPEHGIAGHGYPPRAVLVGAVHAAVRELVLPGFDYVAISTEAAREWFAVHTA